jgi:hypothetical protein
LVFTPLQRRELRSAFRLTQHTVRYYGIYFNKTRGQTSLIPVRIIRPPSSNPQSKIHNPKSTILNRKSSSLPPPPENRSPEDFPTKLLGKADKIGISALKDFPHDSDEIPGFHA